METKPYRIQSPEDIAKDYGGNKQKIAQAMQMGVVDPTAGVLAGMFIDRMRSAQVQEGAQAPTVAQQVFAPPAPPAPPAPMGGMGPPPGAPPMGDMPMGAPPAPPMDGMPMGAPPMGAPPMGAPPMGAPPMGGMPPGAPPMGGMPPGAPPMGDMPMGMADGGLAMLPIPETMFDEPNNGGYADGGIVAFNPGGLTSTPDYSVLRQMMADFGDENKGREQYEAMYQPKREASERLRQFYGNALSEEAQKKRGKQDLNSFLMSFGAKLASTRGPLLSAAGEAAGQTLPGYQESVKERRAEQRDALRQLAADEGMTNAEQREFAKYMMGRKDKQADLAQNVAQVTSADARAQAQNESAERISREGNAARIRAALIGAGPAGEKAPGFSEKAVTAAFQRKLANNSRLPVAKTAKEFNANPAKYQKSQEALLDEAFAEVMTRSAAGRSSMGALTPAEIRANVQGGRMGGGAAGVTNLGGWNDKFR